MKHTNKEKHKADKLNAATAEGAVILAGPDLIEGYPSPRMSITDTIQGISKPTAQIKPTSTSKQAAMGAETGATVTSQGDMVPTPKPSKKTQAKRGEKDKYGLVIGSGNSIAAGMYASEKGATNAEIKEATGQPRLNFLKQLDSSKFEVVKKQEVVGKRKTSRYWIREK